jgi:hypothetical protein
MSNWQSFAHGDLLQPPAASSSSSSPAQIERKYFQKIIFSFSHFILNIIFAILCHILFIALFLLDLCLTKSTSLKSLNTLVVNVVYHSNIFNIVLQTFFLSFYTLDLATEYLDLLAANQKGVFTF